MERCEKGGSGAVVVVDEGEEGVISRITSSNSLTTNELTLMALLSDTEQLAIFTVARLMERPAPYW